MNEPIAEKDAPVERLRDALAAWANSTRVADSKPGARHDCFNEDECRGVFADAAIEIPEAAFADVAQTFRRLPFYGGNYTLDAKRLLRSIPPGGSDA